MKVKKPVRNLINLKIALLQTLLLFITYGIATAQTLRLNEIMASNAATIADEDGDYEDWIELYNFGSEPIALGGYGLSDDFGNPFRWVFPDVTIMPGEFLLVWASGKNRAQPDSPLHSNFSISAAGEEVLITHPSGTRIDEIQPIAIPTDISYGRQPDGTGEWFFFDEPTPGTPNSTISYPEIQPTPVFSHEGGLYTESFQLSLESGPGAVIYYTTNGQLPMPGAGIVYTSPISVTGTAMIRARAYREGYLPSEPKTMIYSRIGEGIQGFSSNLPVVILHQFNIPITPDDRTPASAVFVDHNMGDSTSFTGDIALQSRILANIRGTTSQSVPKKMFGFHLVNEADGNRDESLFGLPAEHNWILYAPYSDKTLMRNAIAYTLGSSFGRWAPRIQFVELFLHSGNGPVSSEDYHGVYMLVERIKWGDERLNITKIRPGDNTEPEITGGYIIKRDRLNPGETGMTTDMGTLLAFVRPSENDITHDQKAWIRNYLNDFETILFSPDFNDSINGYSDFIEIGSFEDHFLITELLKEIDGFRLSTFMYKDRGEKLVMGPVWDFNLSLGNANYLEGWLPEGWYWPLVSDHACGNWYERFLEDPAFQQRLSQRWWHYRQNIFSEESLTELIFGFKNLLGQAQQRNFNRWPILGKQIWPNWYVGETWEDEVAWMHCWLMTRLNWMDNQMGDPPVFPHNVLLHYWLFDNGLPNDTPLQTIEATYQLQGEGFIGYHSSLKGYPFQPGHTNWRKASMERRNAPTEINYRPEGNNGIAYDDANMRGLQVRQPFTGDAGENTMFFHLPTTGYENVIFRFAAKDEGAAESLILDYSVEPETPQWTSSGLAQDVFPLSAAYHLYEVDFSGIDDVDDNEDFIIRIRFDGSNMAADDGNRVTFNNFSLDGVIIEDTNHIPVVKNPFILEPNYPNPFRETTIIKFHLVDCGYIHIVIFNYAGEKVDVLTDGILQAGTHEIVFNGSNLPAGLYFLQLLQNQNRAVRKMMIIR